jgi:ATP-dependent Clp protease ATP-binding subunit ClpA
MLDSFDGCPLEKSARRAVQFAIEEATISGHGEADDVALLLGLLTEHWTPATAIIEHIMGPRLDLWKELFVQMYEKPPSPPEFDESQGGWAISARLAGTGLSVLKSAKEEAHRRNATSISIEHLLVALVQDNQLPVNACLRKRGITYESVCQAMFELVGTHYNETC